MEAKSTFVLTVLPFMEAKVTWRVVGAALVLRDIVGLHPLKVAGDQGDEKRGLAEWGFGARKAMVGVLLKQVPQPLVQAAQPCMAAV